MDDAEIMEEPDEPEEPDDDFEGASVDRREEPDVLLDVPALKIDEIDLEVDDLRARVTLQAEVLDLLKLNVGADVALGHVKLDIKGVDAQALLKVRLDNVAEIVGRVLTTIDRHPEILEQLTSSVSSAVRDVGSGAEEAVGEVGRGAGDTVRRVGAGAGKAVEDVGEGAESATRDAGSAAAGTVEKAGDAVEDAEIVGEVSDAAEKAGSTADDTAKHAADGRTAERAAHGRRRSGRLREKAEQNRPRRSRREQPTSPRAN